MRACFALLVDNELHNYSRKLAFDFDKTRGEFMFDAWTNNGKSAPASMVSASATSVTAQ